MSDIKFTYLLLKTILFVVFLISGYLLAKSKNKKQYWFVSLIPIISFAIISGLRFGRDIDYNVYYLNYIGRGNFDELEFFFQFILRLFKELNWPYSFFIICCSTFLIYSFLYLLYEFRWASLFILPLFLGIMGIENLIKWYLSLSFLFIATRHFLNYKYYAACFFAIISINIHYGMLFCLFIILLFYFFGNNKLINPKMAILIFFLSLFFGSTNVLIQFSQIANIFNFSLGIGRLDSYLVNASDIAGGNMQSGILERTLSNNIRQFIAFSIPIYFGCSYIKRFKPKNSDHFIWLSNLCIISIVIMPLFNLVEIFNRISSALISYSIIYIGFVIWYMININRSSWIKVLLCKLCFILLIYPIIKIPFDRKDENQMLFIWNSNGREFLPNTLPDYLN